MNVSRRSLTHLALVLSAVSLCSAAHNTHNVNLTIGAGSITGDIVTDGAMEIDLAPTDIVDWNLLLNDGTTTFDLLGPASGPNSPPAFINCDPVNDFNVAASSTQLLYDFGAPDGRYFIFEEEDSNGINTACWNTPDVNCAGSDGDVGAESLSIGRTPSCRPARLSPNWKPPSLLPMLRQEPSRSDEEPR